MLPGMSSPTTGPVPKRLLMGSGPSPVPERVLAALAQPTVGHLDPAFGEIMSETCAALREVFVTANEVTFPLSSTGGGGMDTLVTNFVEPGDRVVLAVCGLFGERLSDALGRAGAEVVRVEGEWGRAIPPERLIEAAEPGLDAMVLVHGETSTGVCQPLEGLAEAVRERDALLLADCVTSLSGQALAIDEAGIDAAFSGSQKCINCPPGLAPFTVGERALAKLEARAEPPRSWYFDVSMLRAFWVPDGARAYHHTVPINMVYALREALAVVLDEGLEQRWERHRIAHEALRAALSAFGLERLAPDGEQLHPLLAVRVPEDIDEAAARGQLLSEHDVEIAGGLGPLAGKSWRIGVMGVGATLELQRPLVEGLGAVLGRDSAEALAALEAGWA